MKIVGIIPARGGSKSIQLKNLKEFCGKPLIAWSIISAKKSELDRIIVTTDNPQIAEVAKQYGAEVPFFRPSELAADTVGMEPVLQHTYEWLRDNEGYYADGIMLLQSTSPLRQTFHINDMLTIFKKKNVDSVVSVNQTPANHTPYWTLIRDQNEKVTLWGGLPLRNMVVRRQDFTQECYARNDLGYVLRPKNLYESIPNLYGDIVELYETPEAYLYEADINTLEEWREAELKAKRILIDEK